MTIPVFLQEWKIFNFISGLSSISLFWLLWNPKETDVLKILIILLCGSVFLP